MILFHAILGPQSAQMCLRRCEHHGRDGKQLAERLLVGLQPPQQTILSLKSHSGFSVIVIQEVIDFERSLIWSSKAVFPNWCGRTWMTSFPLIESKQTAWQVHIPSHTRRLCLSSGSLTGLAWLCWSVPEGAAGGRQLMEGQIHYCVSRSPSAEVRFLLLVTEGTSLSVMTRPSLLTPLSSVILVPIRPPPQETGTVSNRRQFQVGPL